jgi:capsular exopolysaccharide synthesis family protein
MSNVYEALRQKEQETAFVPGTDIPACRKGAGNADVPLADPPVEIGDNVLRAALMEEGAKSHRPASTPHAFPSTKVNEAINPLRNCRKMVLAGREIARLVFRTAPQGLAAEQFRFMRRTLEQRFPKGGVLLITSAAPRDGKTLTALNLCTCLADSGQPTLLIEGDIRQPSIHKLIGGENAAPGIEHVLAGTSTADQAIQYAEELSLHIAMVAAPPADPSRLIGGPGVRNLLTWARSHFHWIVIDSPPVLPAADVALLAPLADATLLVVRAQSTPRASVARALDLLGEHVLGVVLNEASVETSPYYRRLDEHRPSGAEAERGDPSPRVASGTAAESKSEVNRAEPEANKISFAIRGLHPPALLGADTGGERLSAIGRNAEMHL